METAPGRGPIRGEGQWLFLRAEGHLLLTERFWGEDAQRVSQVAEPAARDPLPQILDFRDQLAARGVDLLFVPVPAKLAIYPEKVFGSSGGELPRLDTAVQGFLALLESRAVTVIDLTPVFLEAKQATQEPLYLATDSHWSPTGIRIAAATIASALRSRGERSGLPESPMRLAPLRNEVVDWRGDIAGMLQDLPTAIESVTLERVAERAVAAPGVGSASPLLLLGDSYLRIFEEESADLRSHLERLLGTEIDQIAVDAGGPTASRQALARQPERLRGKRVVVWISAARLFVSGLGWRPVAIPAAEPARD